MIPMRISKKILACVLAALMAICMMPMSAFAATYVAEIDGTGYTTVAAAFKAAPTDGTETTITLIADSTSTSNIGVYGGTWSDRVGGKNIVLDLNGYTYTQNKTNGTGAFVLAPSQDLTVGNDLTITDSSAGKTGKVTSNSQYTTVQVGSNCTFTFDGGTIENTSEDGQAIQISGTGKVYFNDGTATANADAIYMYEASGNTTPSIEIKGGEINGSTGIYTEAEASVEMTAGTINADWAFVLDEDSTVNVSGGTVNATYVGYIYDDNADINITGGTFSSDASEFLEEGLALDANGTVKALPTATVTDITADTAYDVAYEFAANNDGTDFNDFYADFIVTVDKPVNTAAVQLYGKIGSGEWTAFPAMVAEADTDYYLARDAFQWQPTYEDICSKVGTFSCAVKGASAEETNMTVKLVIYKDGSAPIVINSFDYVIPGGAVLPTATITPIEVEGLEAAYRFEADENDTASAYANYKADFEVSFDAAIPAGAVTLKGNYGEFGWRDIEVGALSANEAYKLLANNGMGDVTYNDVVTLVKEFECGAVSDGTLDGVTITVALNIYEDDNAAPITIATKTFKFAADKMSITVEEKVDLNIYVADNADDIATIEFTYNSTPDKEYDGQKKEIKDADDIRDENGDLALRVELAPAQILDSVKVVAKDADGNVVKEIETSVADYCNTVINNPSMPANVKELAQATLDYGKAASAYFDYNEAAFADVAQQLDAPDLSSIATAKGWYDTNKFRMTNVTYRATSVPELRFYVTDITENDASALNETIESTVGNAEFHKLADGTIVLTVTNIPITKFADQFTVTAGGSDILRFTPLTWVKSAINKDGEMGALAKAIGNYYLKSVAYFG
jgi:hypothetical protein